MNYAYRVNISVKLHGCVGWSGPTEFAHFQAWCKKNLFHVYAHTCICPDKAAQMYFDRISLEHVLGMINFPQIVQTMIIQVICADLSASSRLYVFRNDAV